MKGKKSGGGERRGGGSSKAGGRSGSGAGAHAGSGRRKTASTAGGKASGKASGKAARKPSGRSGGPTARAGRRQAERKATAAPRSAVSPDPWERLAAGFIVVVLGVRLLINAFGWTPVHFDEAQYWAYAQAPDWGYFSKPPLVAWVIRATTDVLGDSLFALRLPAALAHALTAWLIFLAGRRLWDGPTGFWAALGYLAAPGVTLSSMLMTTDALLLTAWAAALLAHIRAAEARDWGEARLWWGALGAAIGVGMLAKYTMIAYPLGALGYGLFAARERSWRGAGLAALVALLVMAPNLAWQASHGFVTLRHVAEDADPGRGYLHLGAFLKFAFGQLAVIGPVFFVALLLAVRGLRVWRDDWGMRLAAWLSLPLLAAMAGLAFATRAEVNWAAPAYVGGALMAARWLVLRGGIAALRAQLVIGVAAALLLWSVAGLYAGQADRLTRRLDPFRELRVAEPFCALVLSTMAEEGADALLSNSRKRLSECMFLGGLGWGEVAIWNPDGRPDNHHELVASLQPGDDRVLLLAVHRGAAAIARHFREAREIESGQLATHIDRAVPYALWIVRGFRGYGAH